MLSVRRTLAPLAPPHRPADSHPLAARRFAPHIKRLKRTAITASRLVAPTAAYPQADRTLNMSELLEQKKLISHIRSRFPAEASQTDKWLTERGFDQEDLEEMTYAWLESFADRTKEAVLEHNAKEIKELTGFIAEQYRANSDVLHNIINVAYAENIMWGVDDNIRVWAWPHIAKEVKQLYEAMWGVPRSNKSL